jgi:hypothetical protein
MTYYCNYVLCFVYSWKTKSQLAISQSSRGLGLVACLEGQKKQYAEYGI